MEQQKNNRKKNNVKKTRGRLLRVKNGYNPNSSSMGSDIAAYLAFAAGSGLVTVFLSHLLAPVDKILRKSKIPPPTPEGESNPQDEL